MLEPNRSEAIFTTMSTQTKSVSEGSEKCGSGELLTMSEHEDFLTARGGRWPQGKIVPFLHVWRPRDSGIADSL